MVCGGRITGSTDASSCFIRTNSLQTSVYYILVLHVTLSTSCYPIYFMLPYLLHVTLSTSCYPIYFMLPYLLHVILSTSCYPIYFMLPYLLYVTLSTSDTLLLHVVILLFHRATVSVVDIR